MVEMMISFARRPNGLRKHARAAAFLPSPSALTGWFGNGTVSPFRYKYRCRHVRPYPRSIRFSTIRDEYGDWQTENFD